MTEDEEARPRSAWSWFLLFGLAMAAVGALTVWHAFASHPALSNLVSASPSSALAAFGGSDPGSYLRLALDWQSGSVPDSDMWILRLWPPGMPATYYVLLALPGALAVKVAVLAVIAWAGTGAAVSGVVAAHGRLAVAVVFAATWLAVPMTATWVWGQGVMGNDGLGTALLVLGVLALLLMEARLGRPPTSGRRVAMAVLAGATLTGALYFRWAAVTAVVAVVVVALLALLVSLLRRRSYADGARHLRDMRMPLLALLSTIALLVLPWLAYRFVVVTPHEVSWTKYDFVWAQRWMTDEDLRSIGGDWLVPAGANWACHADPERCAELRTIALNATEADFPMLRDAALESMRTHPVAFAQDRFDTVLHTWFTDLSTGDSDPWTVVSGWVVIAWAAIGAVLAVRRWRAAPVFVLALAAMVVGQVVALSVSHIEPRFWIPTVGLVLAGTALLSVLQRPRRPGPSTRPD
jgi:hypothetical protein